ncbi:hypothetical protein PG995_009785 [Apiospora arundinis]|uniref:DUF7924 domain-containing protein n=1 Tax=Apiospora arundinis TaxID=335852 RepID=A0ABR2JMG4_9PEZI
MNLVDELSRDGAYELDLINFLRDYAFPTMSEIQGDGLILQSGVGFVPEQVPGSSAVHRVSIPEPDLLYGYDIASDKCLFTRPQRRAIKDLVPRLGNISQEGHLGFPFLLVEVTGKGNPAYEGGLEGAKNQCLGGAAACLEVINKLNRFVKDQDPDTYWMPEVSNLVFSIAVTQHTAEVYKSTMAKEVTNTGEVRQLYYTEKEQTYSLREPESFSKFYKYIREIIYWGTRERLRDIQ